MRTAILVIHKSGAAECKHGAPDAIRSEFKRNTIEGVAGADRMELWESGAGIVRRHRFDASAQTADATVKRGPGRPRKEAIA